MLTSASATEVEGLASEGEGGEEQEERHEWLHGRGWVCLGTRLWYKEPRNIAKNGDLSIGGPGC